MNTERWRKLGWCATVAALLLVTQVSGASAQEIDDCRCVDRDGNAIENCTCFVMPDVERLFAPGIGDGFGMAFSPARPRLGVTVSTDQDGALDAQGARVTDVMDDGPADEAGIQAGDIITSVAGLSLLEPLPGDAEEDFDLDRSIPVQRLLAIARDLEPGQAVTVEYLRDGQGTSTDLEAEDLARVWGMNVRELIRPEMDELRERLREQRNDPDRGRRDVRIIRERMPGLGVPGTARFGLELIQLTPGLGAYFGTEEGVLVTDVSAESELGLQAGDVLLRVGDREATSPERVRRILASYGGDEDVALRVRRQGREIDVLGRLGD